MKIKLPFLLLLVMISITTLASAQVVPSGVVSYYDLDELSGSVVLDSEDNFNGTNVGATQGVEGIINTAYDFDGVNDQIDLNSFDINTSAAFTVNAWFKANETNELSQGQWIIGQGLFGSGVGTTIGVDVYQNRLRSFFYVGTTSHTTDIPFTDTTDFNMITIVSNLTTFSIYLNGALVNSTSIPGTINNVAPGTTEWIIGNQQSSSGNHFNGTIDEVSIFSTNLSASEIEDYYNSYLGSRVELLSPEDEFITSDVNLSFNSSLIPDNSANFENTNATLNIWNSNGTLFYDETNIVIGNSTNSTQWNVTGIDFGDYEWNVLGCFNNGTITECIYAPQNYTFTIQQFEIISQNFSTETTETQVENFTIDVQVNPDFTVLSAILVYNGTNYPNSEVTDSGSGQFTITREIFIPVGETGFSQENRSFFWNITFQEILTGQQQTQVTDTEEQIVNELIFINCDSPLANVTILNFTIIDEESGEIIDATMNPTTFQATFNVGLTEDFLAKNYSDNNVNSTDNPFLYCTDMNQTIYVDMSSIYSAEDYVERNYHLSGASVSNDTSDIPLLTILEVNAIEFFITVTEDLAPLSGVIVVVDKFFIGEGVYKTVEIDQTSQNTGEFTSFLELDRQYRFTIIRDGIVLGVLERTSSCQQAPCTLQLNIGTVSGVAITTFNQIFAENVLYNLSFSQETKVVTFSFIDTTGTATYFRLVIYEADFEDESEIIFDQQLFTSSGVITANLSNYTSGDFLVKAYISRSPEMLIDYITFVISDASQRLGLLGLFVGFIFVLTVIFSLSFSPTMLVFSVPLSLTAAKLMFLISLDTEAIVLIYVLAALAFYFMNR